MPPEREELRDSYQAIDLGRPPIPIISSVVFGGQNTFEQAVELLQIPAGTVKMYLSRALKQMRLKMKEVGDGQRVRTLSKQDYSRHFVTNEYLRGESLMVRSKKELAWIVTLALIVALMIPSIVSISYAEAGVQETLVWSMATDPNLQGLTVGQSGIGSAFDGVSPAMLVSGTPLVTIVNHRTEANQVSFQLSQRSQNWHALDFMFPAIGVQRGGAYRFVARGRIGGTGNRQVQWNQTDAPWSLIAGSRVTVPTGVTEWTVAVTLDRHQINTALNDERRGLRIQTGNAPTVTLTIDDVFVYQIGDINTEGLPLPPRWNLDEPSLAQLFEPFFSFGNIYSTHSRMNFANTNQAFLHHFNAVTAENMHKPDHIAGPAGSFVVPTPEQFNFVDSDRIINWAIENNLKLKGHAFVWHSQSPNWLFRRSANVPLTRAEAKSRMEYYMRTFSEHLVKQGTLGAFYAWDVVNEAIASGGGTWVDRPGNWRTQMRTTSPWFMAFNTGLDTEAGEHASDFIFYAFYYARKYFPYSTLYYNDYNEEIPAKRNAIAQMVEEINEIWENHPDYDGRLLIEAIGMQSHYHIEGWTTNLDNVAAALDRYIATGARVSVTELDITFGGHGSPAYPSLSEAQLQHQADVYARIFGYYLERAKYLSRVSIWGMSDAWSWRSTGFPLLFDARLDAKPAFRAIVNLVQNWEKPTVVPPTIQTKNLDALASGERLFTMLDVTRACNAPVWFSIVDGKLPTGVTLHSRTGVLEGTPATEGRFNFTVAARNHGGTTTQNLTLVVDSTPPVITAPATFNVIVGASSSLLTGTATDIVDPHPTLTNNAPDFFGPGTTTVTWTALDASGNVATATTTVTATYCFGGIRQPINADGSSVFRLGSTVPVKFQLRDNDGRFVTNAIARISLTRTSSFVTGSESEAVSTSAATTGNLFRYCHIENQYIFNWGTRGLERGTWWIWIELNDGTMHSVRVSLR